MKENLKLAMVQKINKKMSGSTDSYKMTENRRNSTKETGLQKLQRLSTRHVADPKSSSDLGISVYASGE